MPSHDSRHARNQIKHAMRSPDRHVRSIATTIARSAGVLKADHRYNLSDRQAIDLAARIYRALSGATGTQEKLDLC